jgi:hypothetical protein
VVGLATDQALNKGVDAGYSTSEQCRLLRAAQVWIVEVNAVLGNEFVHDLSL